MKVIAEYEYIYSVINYDYIASIYGDYCYDYFRSCNRLQSITITDYDYSNPVDNTDYWVDRWTVQFWESWSGFF